MSTHDVEITSEDFEKTRRRRSRKPANPLQAGILSFCAHSGLQVTRDEADGQLPKRFTLYSPLLLLPANFAKHSQSWEKLYLRLDGDAKQALFASIASAFSASGKPVTHVAINAPIALEASDHGRVGSHNVLRSPSGLSPVYGDFGPVCTREAADAPTRKDFEEAFWVSTIQLAGIIQTWAPRWTMFSRGNFSEKARVLQLDDRVFPGMTEAEIGNLLDQVDVVDMYVGIGYFAFSYLKSGVRTVWGCDLNPWSIEGLRRGCEKNGWRCVVVKIWEYGRIEGTSASDIAHVIAEGTALGDPVRCVAFLGDNHWAAAAICSIHQELTNVHDGLPDHSIRHINLGLLPTSQSSWKDAVRLLDDCGGWLHVHENVDSQEITARSEEVVRDITKLAAESRTGDWRALCVHVEQVKTYAPGVVHCVFDINLSRDRHTGGHLAQI